MTRPFIKPHPEESSGEKTVMGDGAPKYYFEIRLELGIK
jgi:hypothetical protein